MRSFSKPAPSARLICLLLLSVAGVLATPSASAQPPTRELHIAAAADLQPVLPALAAAYQQAAGVKLIASFGSSATLTEQLINGAPQDLFLSADTAHPQQLFAAGLTDASPKPYARGILVLWARRDSAAQPLPPPSDTRSAVTREPAASAADLRTVLLKPSVTRVAVANPSHAPYGAAAQAALQALALTDPVAPKLVTAENVAQTAQFALTGNAQAAFISLTIANSAPFRAAGTYLRVPALYPPIQQAGVALKRSPNLEAARAFLQWLTSPETQGRLHDLGLEPVH